MKKLTYLFLLIFVIGSVGCKKYEDHIVKVWDIEEITFTGTYEDTTNNLNIPFSGEVTNLASIDATIEFFADGTLKGDTDAQYKLKVSVFGFNIPEIPINQLIENGAWDIKGDILYITHEDGGKTEYFIEELTRKEFIISANQASNPNENLKNSEFRMVMKRKKK
ncbi:MAG: hypothetical protein WC994_10240 [Brumimicrobium sp.]